MSNYPDDMNLAALPSETTMTSDESEAFDRVQAAHRDYQHMLSCYVAVLKQRKRKATVDELEGFLEAFADHLSAAVADDVRMLTNAGYDAEPLPNGWGDLLQAAADSLAETESPLFAQVKGMVRPHDTASLHAQVGGAA